MEFDLAGLLAKPIHKEVVPVNADLAPLVSETQADTKGVYHSGLSCIVSSDDYIQPWSKRKLEILNPSEPSYSQSLEVHSTPR
jgi:hypothetical protein